MKTKSKVTSIRVEPELYEKFKEAVEAEGRQVSAVVSGMMNKHVESYEMQMDLRQRNHNRLKIGFDKIKNEIDWTKVSKHTFITISLNQIANSRTSLTSLVENQIKETGFKNPRYIKLETGNYPFADFLVLEQIEE